MQNIKHTKTCLDLISKQKNSMLSNFDFSRKQINLVEFESSTLMSRESVLMPKKRQKRLSAVLHQAYFIFQRTRYN